MQAAQIQALVAFERGTTRPEVSQSAGHRVVHEDLIELAAQSLFEFVFSRAERLDSKHRWTDCDEATKQGFRGEARAVIDAVWPFLIRLS